MRALELDPDHFFEVKPEPADHEHAFYEHHDMDVENELPRSENGYFHQRHHHLSKKQEMRALELDPHHFYEVEQEPVHHDHHYYSEFDAHDGHSDDDYSDDDDVYYEHLIGAAHDDDHHDFSD